jgi:hypothetical protein
MPLNMRSHAHGQGYADLNFLIPELLAEMRLRKGPYGADQGDFANAGQVLGDGGPGWFADARLRIFGARPLVEDNSVRSSPTAGVNLRGGYRFDVIGGGGTAPSRQEPVRDRVRCGALTARAHPLHD